MASSLSESRGRVEDTVARHGGEEFVAILPGTDLNGAYAVATSACASQPSIPAFRTSAACTAAFPAVSVLPART
ncbi:MAG: diguanylate cyclase [Betaproteobacteria bacterium]|nr:diguanylate cyclase [Betaproteobacteria bacterium]